jgi:orotate phosphoribosyltransferase
MMTEYILKSLPIRQGHFRLESGYHTDVWFTLDALFVVPHDIAPLVAALACRLRPYRVTAVCGPLLGGAFLAHAVAVELGSRFYFTQPALAGNAIVLFGAEYRLPSELHRRVGGERVAVVDDAISAGSSVRATMAALAAAGASTVVVGTLLILGSKAKEYFSTCDVPVEALVQRDFALWEPMACPLCKAGMSLEDPVRPPPT